VCYQLPHQSIVLLTVGKDEEFMSCVKIYYLKPAHFFSQEFSPPLEGKDTFYKVFTEIDIVEPALFFNR